MALSSTAVDLLGAWIGKKHKVKARNRLLYTNDLTNAVWLQTTAPFDVTVTLAAAEVNPLGGTGDVYKIAKATTGSAGNLTYVYQSAQSFIAGADDVASMWIKKGPGDGGTHIAGIAINDGIGTTFSTSTAPTSWTRYEVTRELSGSATKSEFRIYPDWSDSSNLESIYAWRPQLEYGEIPTQYQEIVENFDEFPGPVVFAMTIDLYDIVGAATETLYLADRNYRTASDHTPANTLFHPRLIVPDVSVSVSASSRALGGRAIRNIGVIEISNPDGELDSYLDLAAYDWEGRTATLYVGADTWDFDEFEVIVPAARIRDLQFNDDEIRFDLGNSLFDPGERLQSVVYKQDLETITNSDDEAITDSDDAAINSTLYPDILKGSLDGRPMPAYIGQVWNAKPVLEDTNYSDGTNEGLYRYRLSYYLDGDGPKYTFGITNVYEGGVEATEGTDWDNIERGGQDRGELVYYSKPQADIHCIEPAETEWVGFPGVFAPLPAHVMTAILKYFAGLQDSEIDSSAADTYDYSGIFPAEAHNTHGYWTDQPVSIGEVLDFMAQPIGWWGPNFDGSKITFGWFKDLTSESIDLELDNSSIVSLQRLRTAQPTSHVTTNAFRNYGVPGTILAAVDEEDRDRLGEQWSQLSYGEDDASETISTKHAGARSLTVDSPLAWINSATYSPLGSEYLPRAVYDILKEPNSFFEADLTQHVGESEIGDIVNVTYPRYGLDSGRKMMVTGIRLSPKARNYKLKLWAGPV
jgi:hypothetical protein